jgi:hypothetical protein
LRLIALDWLRRGGGIERPDVIQPAGRFSAHRLQADLRSQGFAIAKDTVHDLIDHL